MEGRVTTQSSNGQCEVEFVRSFHFYTILVNDGMLTKIKQDKYDNNDFFKQRRYGQ